MSDRQFYVGLCQKVLCWAAMFALAWNPDDMFKTLIENLGVEVPFFMAASGAGSDFARAALKEIKNFRDGGGKP